MGLLGATTALAGGVQQGAQVALSAGLDENWRGAFDLLLTPAGQAPAACRTADRVRVAPNYASGLAGEGLTIGDLERIRAVPGVEVAAPIGLVGVVGGSVQQLTLNMGRPEGLLAFSTDTTIVLEDGVQELPVVQVHDRFALDGGTLAGLALGLGQAVTEDGTVLYAGGAALGGFPPMWQTMIAVDPVAEEELLGGSGVFLDPLVTAGALGDRTRAGLHPEWGEIIREETIGGPGMPEDTIVPIVVNTDPQFRLEATVVGREVDVSRIQPLWVQGQLDRPEPSEVFQREIWTAPNTVELGTTSAVFGEEFVPFTLRPTAVEPDWLPPADQPGFQSVGYSLVERTVPREVEFTDRAVPGVDCAMEVMPVGAPHRESWLLPSQDPNAEFTRGQSGYSVQDYRDDTDVGGMNGGLFRTALMEE